LEVAISSTHKYTLTYGTNNQRVKSVYVKPGATTQTKYYAGPYEEIVQGGTRKNYYIYAGGEIVAVYTEGNPELSAGLYYFHNDHLGSPWLITNAAKGEVQRLSYDAWGRRRDANDWNKYSNLPAMKFDRGYTGHEHLDMFELINMNARMYNPALGRFLSADPFVQAPDFSQTYNRYSYANNNPMSYIDPSGEIAWFIPVIIGAVIGGTSGATIGHSKGAKGWDMFWHVAGGATVGGLSGGAATGVSALGGAAWWAGAAAGAVGGAGFNGLSTGWDAAAMLKGAGIGAFSGFAGGGLGSAIGGGWGAVAGGAASSGLSTALNGGILEQVGISMLLGGALSYGTYELTSYIAYKQANLGINGHRVTYNQFKTIQADYQRSRFWRKEYGGILTKNGGVVRASAKNRHSLRIDFTGNMINAANNDGGSAASYHTHWARGGIDYYVNNMDDIVNRANAAYLSTTSNGPSPGDMNGLAKYFGGNQFLIDRTNFYYYNTAASTSNSAFFLRYFPMCLW
jgi:RHS repeat-associated protein